jgi:ubiquinone/menaquinone biosynthesis C-methylase UbiE
VRQGETLAVISNHTTMQEQKDIIDCYDKTAKNYAEKFIDELRHKHLDRILLESFASENRDKGTLIDLGCGPGQTTRYLADCGVTNILGVDIAPNMVCVAKSINPQLHFETADMLALQYPDRFFGSAIAFYSIVHFDYGQIKLAFREIRRVLAESGQFLFSFHVGDNLVHLDNFLDHQVNIDFYFLETHRIRELLTETGFEIVDIIERQPYNDAEYPSKRAYIWTQNNNR